MRFSSILSYLAISFLGMLALPSLAQGQITLQNSPYQSNLEAAIQAYPSATVTNTSNVNSLPFSGSATKGQGNESSSVTGTLTNSSLVFNIAGSIGDTSSFSLGQAVIYFNADAGVTFTLSGSSTLIGTPSSDGLEVNVYDVTTGIASYELVSHQTSPGTVTLSTAPGEVIGSLNGSLKAGDLYEFQASESIQTGTTLSGPVAVNGTFTLNLADAPEPSTWAMLLSGTLLLCFWGRRKLPPLPRILAR